MVWRRRGKAWKDARITHDAVRKSWFHHPRLVNSLIAGVLLVVGVGIGTSLGLWLSSGNEEPSIATIPITPTPPNSGGMPEGSPLPVIVAQSESALRLYEESLATHPEELRPDPNQAPPLPPPVETPPTLNSTEPNPVPETVVAAAPSTVEEMPPTSITPQVSPVLPPSPPALNSNQWLAYAVSVPNIDTRPMIAIVFDDLGIDQARSRRTIALPPPLTFAFLPYGYNLREMVGEARRRGHEILVHVPMAPLNLGVDPGPNALQRELGPAEILRRLDWDLSQFEGYIGINNHMGSRFTADRESMRLVLQEVKRRGLVFMDSVTTTDTAGYPLAAEMGVPFAVRDVFLDHVIAEEAIRRQLQRVEETARQQGHAIAIGHPHDETITVVSAWMRDVEARGFRLVPLSAIIQRRATQ